MKIIKLRELNCYTFDELLKIFLIEDYNLVNILNLLSKKNIVKQIKQNNNLYDLEELYQLDFVNSINMESDMYTFKFVGILIIDSFCLIIYPKYLNNYKDDSYNNYKLLRQVLSVIKKYKSKEQKLYLSEGGDDNFNFLSLAVELLYNYYEYGLYSNDKQIIELNGDGEINWDITINNSAVFYSENTPIFLDLYTLANKNNEQDFYRRLHAFVLTEICHKLSDVFTVLNIESVDISSECEDNFGSREYILYKINQELSLQYVTHKYNTLLLIKKYIENIAEMNLFSNLSFIGTNSFEHVWEDVCSVIKKNCRDKTLTELGILNYYDKRLLSEVIEKPQWTNGMLECSYYSKKTVIPDIITVVDKKLSIYDAKYYNIKLDSSGISNMPGVYDILKQYVYELAYKKFMNDNDFCIQNNAFLFPSEGDDTTVIGTVTLEMFSNLPDICCKNIELIMLPCKVIYEQYLNL